MTGLSLHILLCEAHWGAPMFQLKPPETWTGGRTCSPRGTDTLGAAQEETASSLDLLNPHLELPHSFPAISSPY